MSGKGASRSSQGLEPGTPVQDAAAIVLRRRLGAVADAVDRLERSRSLDDVEAGDIHQVRVSVRRASAALAAFKGCVGAARRLEKVSRRLKKMRRAVGGARTCDVGLEILKHDREASGKDGIAGIALLERILKRRRESSMSEVRKVLRRSPSAKWRKWGKRLSASTLDAGESGAAGHDSTLEEAARRALGKMLHDVQTAAAENLKEAISLHELRLTIKRLRYATEVFGPCFEADRLDEATSVLVQVQDRLGAVNDLSEILALVDGQADEADTDMTELRAMYGARFDEARDAFNLWWDGSGKRSLFRVYSGWLDAKCEGLPASDCSGAPLLPITPGVHGSTA